MIYHFLLCTILHLEGKIELHFVHLCEEGFSKHVVDVLVRKKNVKDVSYWSKSKKLFTNTSNLNSVDFVV